MRVTFHPEALDEFLEAIEWYEEREIGLGEAFSAEVFSTIEKVQAWPGVWPISEGRVRRCLVNRFPYGILYSNTADDVFVLAIMHLHRQPGYWKDRK